MDNTTNAINWFEIPVTDMARAKKFYENIFSIQLHDAEMPDAKMAFFPADAINGKVGGALVKGPYHKPSAEGAKLYLNGNPDLQQVLDRIEEAGGKISSPKELIDPQSGYMGFFIDTEGNHVALHSMK
jgi:predicted enzyme related to lactoylglutathione lyase